MSASTRNELSARNSIMMLLTDEENARVTTAEAGGSLVKGSEFLDLMCFAGPRTRSVLRRPQTSGKLEQRA